LQSEKGKLEIPMSVDRNVWIYGTGLLVIVGGCFAIGYAVLPTKPAFNAKQVVADPTPPPLDAPTPAPNAETQVPKLVIEDITAEKVASAKATEEQPPTEPEPTQSSPEELDIQVDTSKKNDPNDGASEPSQIESPPSTIDSEPVKAAKPTQTKQAPPVIAPPKPDPKLTVPPPADETLALFRVRIASIKPTRKEANVLVAELKDKGFSATILPLAGSFVVQTGAFKDRKSAEALQRTLLDNGYDTSISN
jgi:cell division septation protein DedD